MKKDSSNLLLLDINVLIALSWLGRLEIPAAFSAIERLAEIGGVSRAKAREIFGQVEAAVAQWPEIAAEVEVPSETIMTWQKEILQQTRALRADAA